MPGRSCDGRLISCLDAVISRKLHEQTQIALASLTSCEQRVLRLRFGITQTGNQPLDEMDEMLTPDQMAFIEATALRKLRHKDQGVRLKSVDRK
jgi:RNA polymerase primary sigma factor